MIPNLPNDIVQQLAHLSTDPYFKWTVPGHKGNDINNASLIFAKKLGELVIGARASADGWAVALQDLLRDLVAQLAKFPAKETPSAYLEKSRIRPAVQAGITYNAGLGVEALTNIQGVSPNANSYTGYVSNGSLVTGSRFLSGTTVITIRNNVKELVETIQYHMAPVSEVMVLSNEVVVDALIDDFVVFACGHAMPETHLRARTDLTARANNIISGYKNIFGRWPGNYITQSLASLQFGS